MYKWIYFGSWLVAAMNAEDVQITWVNDGRVCVNEVAILRCSYSDQQAHILDGQLPDWKIDGGNVAFPNHVASRPSSNLNELHVNVTKLIDILCFFLIYENGEVMDSISSKSLTVHPKELRQPEKPVTKHLSTTSDSLTLMLDHNRVCFGKHTFFPQVCVSGSATCVNGHFDKNITIDNLSAGKNYTLSATAVCQSDNDIKSQPLTIPATTQFAGKLLK
jgi:hypothetical protein